jgi:hypothetical protein
MYGLPTGSNGTLNTNNIIAAAGQFPFVINNAFNITN